MKRIGNRIHNRIRRSGRSLPTEASKLDTFPHLLAHSGVPEAANSVAYEPIQRLLAIGTVDGRIKILGASGVEKMLHSSRSEATRCILFLTNRGTIVRVEEQGSLEVWGVTSGEMVCRLEVPGDKICCVCQVPREPYLMLGCVSGDMRVACLTDLSGEPTTEAREVKGLTLLNYKVECSGMGQRGDLVGCSVSISSAGPLALVQHSISGVVLWNIRHQKVVMRVAPGLDSRLEGHGGVTAACWVGHLHQPRLLATGHQSGDVIVWKLPDDLREGHKDEPKIFCHCRVAPKGVSASCVSGLSYVSGQVDALLVEGGQSIEEPDALTKIAIPFEEPDDDSTLLITADSSLPWFGVVNGYALIPPHGSLEEYEDPVAVLVLTEGNLMLHDFVAQNTVPFNLPLQSVPPLSTSKLITLRSEAVVGKYIREATGEVREGSEQLGGMDDPLYHWVLSGGEASCSKTLSESSLYFSGHVDGVVRVWDFSCEAPRLLDTVPHNTTLDALGESHVVSQIVVAGCGELLAVGHEDGVVRLYRFSSGSADVVVRDLQGVGTEASEFKLVEKPGYQLILLARYHSSDITALSFNTNSSQLAIGDASGSISIVDVSNASVSMTCKVAATSVHSIIFGPLEYNGGVNDEGALYLASNDSRMAIIDASTGVKLGANEEWLKPKQNDQTIAAILLDSLGSPLHVDMTCANEIPWLPGSNWPRLENSEASNLEDSVDVCTGRSQDMAECMSPPSTAGNLGSEVGGESPESDGADSSGSAAMLAAAVAEMEETSEAKDMQQKKGHLLSKLKVGRWGQGRKKRKDHSKKRGEDASSDSLKDQDITEDSLSMEDKNENEHGTNVGRSESPLSKSMSGDASNVYFLLLAVDSARIFSADSIVHGDRGSVAKASFQSPALFAAPVKDHRSLASGVLVASEDFRLKVYSLPSLEILEDIDMEEIVGWNFAKVTDGEDAENVQHFNITADNMGQLLLRGVHGEIIRVGIVDGCSMVQMPASIYDWDLAAAAHSARKAMLQKFNHSESERSQSEGFGGSIRKGFGTILDAARKARDEFDKAMHMQHSKASPVAPPPELHELFHSREVQVEIAQPCVSPKIPREQRVGDSELLPVHSEEQSGLKAREELFAGATMSAGEHPRVRTADEIREAYGRPRKANATTGRISSLMAENTQMLQERGERLRGLDDKAADLSNEAANFASLAKQLADQQKKKWWQL